LVDPDGLIAQRNLGVAGSTVGDLVNGIHGLFTQPERWRAASTNARRYYVERHTVDGVMGHFERIFLEQGARIATARAQASPKSR